MNATRTQSPTLRQPTLWEGAKIQRYAIRLARDGSLQERFDRWLAANPHVLPTVIRLAREAKAKGYRHYGIAGIWEVMRWQLGMKAATPTGLDTPVEVDLNNDFRALAARKVMAECHDLRDFFRVRRSQVDDPDAGASSRLLTRRSADPQAIGRGAP